MGWFNHQLVNHLLDHPSSFRCFFCKEIPAHKTPPFPGYGGVAIKALDAMGLLEEKEEGYSSNIVYLIFIYTLDMCVCYKIYAYFRIYKKCVLNTYHSIYICTF